MLNLLAQAEAADREADAIFSMFEAARVPDRFRESPLTPAGFEAEAERASDLRRRARHLRAEAAGMAPKATPVAPPSPEPAPVAFARAAPAAKPVLTVETAESVAARILTSDFAAPDRATAPQGLGAGAADTVQATAARILASDTVPGEGHEDAEVDAIAHRIAAA